MADCYRNRFLKDIRKALKLSQQELANIVGISCYEYRKYEHGKLEYDLFFCERMKELFGLDLLHAQSHSRVVICDPAKLSMTVYSCLNAL